MGRRAPTHWDRRERCDRTDAAGRTRYFRGIGREDRKGIAEAFAAYLAELDAQARPPEPTAVDVCLAFVGLSRKVKPRTARTHRDATIMTCSGGGAVATDRSHRGGGLRLTARRHSEVRS